MSEDARKDCRTQGKYSDRSSHFVDRRPQTRQDKRQKVSPTVKEPQEKKFHKRKSDGGKESNISLSSENESSVRYQENSDHKFSQLEDVKRPTEIKSPGKHILSETENGESVIFYDPYFFDEDEAWDLKDRLHNTTNWHAKNIIIHGIEYPQPRLVAWYGPFPYTYSGSTLEPADMPDCVLEIKEKVEHYLRENGINVTLNSVLLNLYRHNKDSVSWHSDDEMSMGVCPTIASVSLGETRKFEMRRKLKPPEDGSPSEEVEECFVYLKSGSLLIMDGCMQKDWQHRVPKEYHDKDVRINLTFRTVYELGDLPPSPVAYSKNQPIDNGLKKSRRSKTDYDVNYDAEDFPPLNSDTSPASSGIAKKSQDSRASLMIKTERNGSKFSGSHKRRDNQNYSYNKTPLKTRSGITGSEEMWDNESPFKETLLETGDKIQRSEKVWNNKRTHSKTPLKTCDNIYGSEEIQVKESSYNKTSLKTDNKINVSEEYWDNEPPPCNENFQPIDAETNGSDKEATEPSYHKKSSLLNNLNDVKKNVKIDMVNKNLCAYDSNVSGNVVSATVNGRKNKNFGTKESHDVPTNSVNNRQENAYEVKNEPTSSKDSRWRPNVEAKEFVPINRCTTSYEDNIYGSFGLENLLNYKVDLMNPEMLHDYSAVLKVRVLEKIQEFNNLGKEELEVLCDITDGNQTDRNQKIITARISQIVERALKSELNHQTFPNFRKSVGNHRKPNHGNQHNYSERRYHSGSREDYHRY